MKQLDDGVILLTGAGGGMGRHVVSYLTSRGYHNLALACRSRIEDLPEILKSVDLEADRHIFQAELTDEAEVQSLRTAVENRLGPVRSLINLAGASSNGVSWKLSREEFRKVIDDNLTSTFLCCREFIPGMRERNGGRIINVSSVVASTGVVGASHYAAAKAGILGFTRSIALELAGKGITANAISLGYFQYGLIDHVGPELQASLKERIPLKRFGTAAEFGGALEFLLSPQGAYTTGQNIQINGGLHL